MTSLHDGLVRRKPLRGHTGYRARKSASNRYMARCSIDPAATCPEREAAGCVSWSVSVPPPCDQRGILAMTSRITALYSFQPPNLPHKRPRRCTTGLPSQRASPTGLASLGLLTSESLQCLKIYPGNERTTCGDPRHIQVAFSTSISSLPAFPLPKRTIEPEIFRYGAGGCQQGELRRTFKGD